MTQASVSESTRFERKAETIKQEIAELTRSLYNLDDPDPKVRYDRLKTFRADIQRGFVISMHLAIEQTAKSAAFSFLC